MSTIRKLFSVNAILAGTLVIGVVNSVAIAAIFGLDRRIDSYFASLMLISLFMALIVDYLGKNFLPVFAARRAESEESASVLASLIICQISLAVGLATVLLVIIAPSIFSLILPGFERADVDQVASIFVIMAPSLVLMVVETFHGYVWQHDEQYSRVVLVRAILPLTLTVFIVGLGPWLGVRALPIGFLCGHILYAIAISFRVPYKFKFLLLVSDEDCWRIIRNSVVLMGTGMIARSRSVIEQYFGSQLGEGAIAAISIADKLCTPVFQKALLGIRMIVFSRSAKASARRDTNEIARLYNLSIVGILIFVVPIAVWYSLETDIIVKAAFQRGAFTDAMANLVIAALIGYSGSVAFAGVVQMMTNGFYSIGRIKVPAVLMPLGTALFLLSVILLVPQLGLMGLTVSSSITAALSAFALMLLFRRLVPAFAVIQILTAFLKYTAFAIVAVLVARVTRQILDLESIIGLIYSGLAVAAFYILPLYLTRDKMLFLILDKVGLRAPGSTDQTTT
jgi:putative peptidoglycan lipid II flippase